MARVSYAQYREVVNEYPEFQIVLKQNIYSYDDVFAKFLKEMIHRLVFIRKTIDRDRLYDMMYKMKPMNH